MLCYAMLATWAKGNETWRTFNGIPEHVMSCHVVLGWRWGGQAGRREGVLRVEWLGASQRHTRASRRAGGVHKPMQTHCG
jgi:hypothetical protein